MLLFIDIVYCINYNVNIFIEGEGLYMRLDTYLFEKGIAGSRTKAKILIDSGRVIISGKTITKPSFVVNENDKIEILPSEQKEFVGRGGIKLEAALDAFSISPKGKICCDIGASTGGFTDCLLMRGANRVYAIDSGSNQLDIKLRNDERVVSLENTNARYITADTIRGEYADLVVMDVSFISQKLLYPAIKSIAARGADVVTLIKPQFEAGRENISKNGIVKDEKVRRKVIEDLKQNAEILGFQYMGLIESPIKGGSGNTEYLIHYKII